MNGARLAAVLLLASPLASGQTGPSVRDNLGQTVTLPAPARRVIAVQPEIARMLAGLDARDTLVGLDYSLRVRDPLFKLVFPEADRVPVVSNAENAINIELVLKLAPDVIFVSPLERRIVEALERKTRIPTVALASLGDFDRMIDELILVGKLVGREDRAAELAAYFRAETGRVGLKIGSFPAARKPRVFLSFWGCLTRTPTSYAPVEAAGGINLADGFVRDAPRSTIKVTTVSQTAVASLIDLQSDMLTSAISDAALRLERASRADNIVELVREQIEMIPATRARIVEDAQRAALIFKHAGRDLRGVATHLYERVVETAEENVPEVKVVKRKTKRAARKTTTRARKVAA